MVTKTLSDVGKTFQRIDATMLKKFLRLQESMTGALAGASYKTYTNSKVRRGQKVKNANRHAAEYVNWIQDSVKKHVRNLTEVVKFQNFMIDAKMQIVRKLNSVKQLTGTFIRTDNGYKVVNPEGYVAIDRVSGGAVKLVDRMEFSFNNFTAIKAWDK